MAATAKLLLKARPTPAQLADRLRPLDGVWPDGIELYLAASDLADVNRVARLILDAAVPDGFVWLIEGPVDSLDGADFDVSRESESDLEVVGRLAQLARLIGAKAVNIHVISPSPDLARLTQTCRQILLERAVPFLQRFVEVTEQAGATATVEHMPPVLRMRRSDFAFTPIGMAADDLGYLTHRIDGLRVLVDTSHGGLYLNARRLPPDPAYPWSAPLKQYLETLPEEDSDLTRFLASFPRVENAQVSNAAGILGEGLAYDRGDFDLDPTIEWLGANVRHIVTETLENNNDDAVQMRAALRRMRAVVR